MRTETVKGIMTTRATRQARVYVTLALVGPSRDVNQAIAELRSTIEYDRLDVRVDVVGTPPQEELTHE